MLRHFISTINYEKLIKMQANQVQSRISKKESKKIQACSQSKKVKTHKLNNIRRHN